MAPLQWTQHPQLAFYSQELTGIFLMEKFQSCKQLYSPRGSKWKNFFFIIKEENK